MLSCTLVVPCYNEAHRLDVDAFRRYAAKTPDVRFFFVDDGSTDRTYEVLEELRREAPAFFAVLRLADNRGKAEAVRRGVLAALEEGPRYVGYWDADLATPLAALPDFLDLLEERPEIDLVMGARVQLLGRIIERRPVRHYLGRVFATGASLVLGLPVYDTQCGAKLFRASDELRRVFAEPFLSRWVFDVEILARLRECGADGPGELQNRLYELPLTEWRDVAGSKVRPADFFRATLDLLAIRRKHPPTRRPTRRRTRETVGR